MEFPLRRPLRVLKDTLINPEHRGVMLRFPQPFEESRRVEPTGSGQERLRDFCD